MKITLPVNPCNSAFDLTSGPMQEFCQRTCALASAAIDELHSFGAYTSHTRATVIPAMRSDLEMFVDAVTRFTKRPDVTTHQDVFQCLKVLANRIQIEHSFTRRIRVSAPNVARLHTMLESALVKFPQSYKGRDVGQDNPDKDGKLYRTNSLHKLGQQKILERGLVLDMD